MPEKRKNSRRQARELGLKALFFLDMCGDLKKTDYLNDFCELYLMELDSLQHPFFTRLIQGIAAHVHTIDDLIAGNSRNWRLSRMPFVDRNILRMAVFEMVHCPDIPCAVSINEAVDLGKIYGTRESGAFINGILDAVRKQVEKERQKDQVT